MDENIVDGDNGFEEISKANAELEKILVMYKIGRITLLEAKILLRPYLTEPLH